MYWKPHTLGSKIVAAYNPKTVFKICEVKEMDVNVHENCFPCITLSNFGHSVPHITSEPGGWGGN